MSSKTVQSLIWGWFGLTSLALACVLVVGAPYKPACALYSVALTITGYAFYISEMFPDAGVVPAKPHPITWAAFAIFTAVGAAAQFLKGSGILGCACLYLTAIGCAAIAVISARRFSWQWSFWSKLLIAFAGLLFVLSMIMGFDPHLATAAALAATGSDLCSYYPMVDKTIKQPHEESIRNLFFNSVKCVPQLIAEPFPLTVATSIYLLMLTVVNGGFALFIWWWRKRVPKPVAVTN